MSSRDNATDESSRRKHSKTLAVVNFLANAGGGKKEPAGPSGGGGRGGNDPSDDTAYDKRPYSDQTKLSKNKKEVKLEQRAQKEIQELILREIGKVRKYLPDGVFDDTQVDDYRVFEKDLEGTRRLIASIFRKFLDQIRKHPGTELTASSNRRDPDVGLVEGVESSPPSYRDDITSKELDSTQGQLNNQRLGGQVPSNASQEHILSRGGHDSNNFVPYGDSGPPRTHLRNVDDVTPREFESMKREIKQLRGDNDLLSKDLRDARGRIKDMEVENSRAVDWAVKTTVEQERRTAQNEKVALKSHLETVIGKDFYKKIKSLEDMVAHERQNVVKETAIREKHHREYRLSKEKLEQKHEEEINDLKAAHSREAQWHLEEFNQKLSDGKRFHEAQVRQLGEEHATVLADANFQFGLEREKWEQIESNLIYKHEKAMDELQQSHEADLASEKQTLLTTIKQLKDKNKAAWEKHDEQISNLKGKHSNELEQLNSQVAEERRALETERTRLLDDVAKTEARLKKEADDTEARREKEYNRKFEEIGEKHENDKVQLRKDRDAYSAALLERDKVRDKNEFLSDVQVTSKYHKLVKEVEDLARLEWKRDPDLESLVKNFSVQPNTLMRQLLQDTIWLVLHEFIFCSPFRIFGEEGKRLEAEWYEQCGEDAATDDNGCYIWPAPEVDTERWRFVTVKECRASLRKPVPSVYDPRVQLKIGYGKAREELRDKLSNRLGDVAIVEKKHKDAIDRLTQQAASMWLEFSMQHYRIVMVIKDPKVDSIKDRLTQAQKSSVDLVIVPRLKSYGNSKGKDLKAEETIKTCEGETHSIGTTKTSRGAPSRLPSISQRN